jgi:hypothetical protein
MEYWEYWGYGGYWATARYRCTYYCLHMGMFSTNGHWWRSFSDSTWLMAGALSVTGYIILYVSVAGDNILFPLI